MATNGDVAKAVLEGNADEVVALCNSLLADGKDPMDILNNGLLAGMTEVGILFKADELFIPEVIGSAEAMKKGTEILKPLIDAGDLPSLGTVIIGTVKGDLHDIGKDLVRMMIEAQGFTVIDLGIDVENETFVKQVSEVKPDILAMSALLTTTMMHMKEVVDQIVEEGLRESVKIIIGGGSVSQVFADKIAVDGYAVDAVAAATLCRNLVENN
jgi:5-methyltetrahydrofolate--homocysteine methyltransferase